MKLALIIIVTMTTSAFAFGSTEGEIKDLCSKNGDIPKADKMQEKLLSSKTPATEYPDMTQSRSTLYKLYR